MKILLTNEELAELQELYMDMEPERVDAIETEHMAGIAEQRAVAVWDRIAARLTRPK